MLKGGKQKACPGAVLLYYGAIHMPHINDQSISVCHGGGDMLTAVYSRADKWVRGACTHYRRSPSALYFYTNSNTARPAMETDNPGGGDHHQAYWRSTGGLAFVVYDT